MFLVVDFKFQVSKSQKRDIRDFSKTKSVLFSVWREEKSLKGIVGNKMRFQFWNKYHWQNKTWCSCNWHDAIECMKDFKVLKSSFIHYQEIWLINTILLSSKFIFNFCQHVLIDCELDEQKFIHLTFVSKRNLILWPWTIDTHTTLRWNRLRPQRAAAATVDAVVSAPFSTTVSVPVPILANIPWGYAHMHTRIHMHTHTPSHTSHIHATRSSRALLLKNVRLTHFTTKNSQCNPLVFLHVC